MSARTWGFKSPLAHRCPVSGHRKPSDPRVRGFPAVQGLVVVFGVEGELADEFACFGVDDGDLEVLDQEQDGGAVPGPADADVVEASGSAEGDAAVVDFVGADAVVGSVRGFGAWCGFGPGLIGRGWGAPVQ